MKLPLRPEGTKNHKELNFNKLPFVQLCALVPWWQKILLNWK
jgi:hypothetical protein